MLTAAAVRTAIDLYCLDISVHLFVFRPDVAQLPSIMADVIMLILKDSVMSCCNTFRSLLCKLGLFVFHDPEV